MRSLRSRSTTGIKVVSTELKSPTENMIFRLHGETATTCGSFNPMILLTMCQRLFDAVAVSAMMQTPGGRMERNSSIRSRDWRKVDPL